MTIRHYPDWNALSVRLIETEKPVWYESIGKGLVAHVVMGANDIVGFTIYSPRTELMA